MSKNENLKKQVYQKLLEHIDEKIVQSKKAIEGIVESRNNETKSSAGDKFETSRAMMQIEQQRNELQLHKALQLQKELLAINIENESNTIEVGSLIITNQGKYFLSIGMGKIQIDTEKIYAISLASPIGKILLGKQKGAKVEFRNQEVIIEDLI